MFRKKRLIVISIFIAFLLSALFSIISTSYFRVHPDRQQEIVHAGVLDVKKTGEQKDAYQTFITQHVTLQVAENGKTKTVPLTYMSDSKSRTVLRPGDTLFITKTIVDGKTLYEYNNRYRLDRLFHIILGFFLLVIFIVGKRGLGSIAGLLISILVIFSYIVPQVLAGHDPFLVSVTGSLIILLFSTYLAHGISKQTTVALCSMIIVLIGMILLAKILIWYTLLTGYGNEESFGINVSNQLVQIKSLLIAGIIIATIGGLDDITTAQSAAVFQLAKEKPGISVYDLRKKGMLVGKEHVLSLINTLIIAFVGSSFTFFVSLFVFYSYLPIWSLINMELIAEEIVESIAISSALILAVPITTFVAAYTATGKMQRMLSAILSNLK